MIVDLGVRTPVKQIRQSALQIAFLVISAHLGSSETKQPNGASGPRIVPTWINTQNK